MTRLHSFNCCILAWAVAMGCAVPEVLGQRRGSSKELGYQVGTMWYLGDVNPTNLLRSISHSAQGAYFRYNLNPRLSLRGQFIQGTIEAFDSDHPNVHQQRRDLGFVNVVNELSFTTEINFRDHVVGHPNPRPVPFLTAGLAVFGHDPSGVKSNGILQPLLDVGTEGQGWAPGVSAYKRWGVAVPFGLGLKGTLGSAMTFQVEWGARKLWTDHLDDVSTIYLNPDSDERLEEPSLALEEFQGDPPYNVEDASDPWADDMKEVFQRGDPGRNDRYGFFLVSLGFRVSKKATTCWEQ